MKNRNFTIMRIVTIIAIVCNLLLPSLIDNLIVALLVTCSITIIVIIILLNLKP